MSANFISKRVLQYALIGAAFCAFSGIGWAISFQSADAQNGDSLGTNTQAVEATKRTISHGDIIGSIEENGAHVWRSIPYAASTEGENRWRAPQAAPAWDGIREVTEFGPRCPQTANSFNEIEGLEYGELAGSEDCLTLDVYAPVNALADGSENKKPLPVMVWIHGGGNVSGSPQIYKAHKLAVNENVIVVGVQYRLGPLGFFAHPDLADQGANYAILDLIAALEWVRDNASAFGGNPDLVTIFGESAGGHNVVSLLAAPKAKGLFHRAIIQSGSFDSVTFDDASGASGDEVNSVKKVTQKVGSNQLEALRGLTVQELFNAYDIGTGFTQLPTIIRDGKVIPSTPLREAFTSTETFHAVPIMTGANRDEMKLFQLANPSLTRKRFGVFYQARDQKLYDTGSDYSSRVWRIRSVDAPAAAMSAAGHQNVYGYRFDWDDGGKILFTDLSKMLGAAHAMEIPFVFNRFKLLGSADKHMFQKKTAASREVLSRAMGQYWASFARDGVPSGEKLLRWPQYSENNGTLLRFDAVRKKNDRGIETIPGGDTLKRLYADLQAEKRVDEKKRCKIAAAITAWVPELKESQQLICSSTSKSVSGR